MCTLIIACLWALAACEPDVVRPGLLSPDAPAPTQSPEPVDVQVAPAGDTYVSRTLPAQNFGADTLLLLDGDHRPLLRWDSAEVAQAIGNGSLLEARLELTVLSNSGGWPGNARWVALHAMSEEWDEGEASWNCSSADPAPCDPWSMDEPEELEGPQGPYHSPWNPQATDSLRVMNNTDGVVTFDVTADVVAALQGGVYRHGWLLKRVNESTGGALEIGAREGGSAPRLVLTVELPEPVPAQAPDTVPAGFYDPENVRMGSACIPGPILRGIVVVRFVQGASHAERQEAIELIGGEVVGGLGGVLGEGWYYVRVEDDKEGQILCDAIDMLNGLPQVSVAAESIFTTLFHRRPNDAGGQWSKEAWHVDPGALTQFSQRWGLEAIAAPLAWGCSTGSEATRVAVVDEGFQSVPDLMGNVLPQWRGDVDVNMTDDHGTKVASVFAARGDNDVGIAGAMWRADLRLYDAAVVNGTLIPGGATVESIVQSIERAAKDGARVINVSSGASWLEFLGRLPDAEDPDDHRLIARYRTLLIAALQEIDEKPLTVLAAGSDGVDAYWAGFPAAKAEFPDNLLVVGASDFGDGLTATSNRGATVDVLAPGDSVGVLDGVGAVITPSGTSYAAPYAAGVAGLLLAFDPTIPPGILKDLILQGARDGDPATDGIPLLNAYEPLKAAARRDSAPLCGSRIAMNGDTVMVQRESGWEHLFTMEGGRGRLNPHHGGRMMDVYLHDDWPFEGSRHRFALQDGTWTHVGEAPELSHPGAPEGSIYNSMMGTSHDRDTTARATTFTSPAEVQVTFSESTVPSNVYATHVIPVQAFAEETSVCLRKNESGDCKYSENFLRVGDVFLHDVVAWAPGGGRIVVSVGRGTITPNVSAWYGCGGDGDTCRDLDHHSEYSQTELYEMDAVSGTWSLLYTLPYLVVDLAISEDGAEIVIIRLLRDEHWRREWQGSVNEQEPAFVWFDEDAACTVEWRSYTTGNVVAVAPFEKTCRTFYAHIQDEVFQHSRDPVLGSLSP